jgi:hypothetical protein
MLTIDKIVPGMYISACRRAGTYNGKVSGQVTYSGIVESVKYNPTGHDTDTLVTIRLVDTNIFKSVYVSTLDGYLLSDYSG